MMLLKRFGINLMFILWNLELDTSNEDDIDANHLIRYIGDLP
jgi:hypothetical protein